MDVKIGEMIDSEDVVLNDPIWSSDALNIVLELPFTNIVGAVALQRVLIHTIADKLSSFKENKSINLYVDGDDILSGAGDNRKKYSVSIATQTAHSSLIHIGLNLYAGKKAPKFAGNLNDLHLCFPSNCEVEKTHEAAIMSMIAYAIKEELNSIYSATLKVLPK
jgi:hypothetical protein